MRLICECGLYAGVYGITNDTGFWNVVKMILILVTAKKRILPWPHSATYLKHPNEKRFELRNNKGYKLTKCRNILLKSDLKQNARTIISQNLHSTCTSAVGRERATLYRFITLAVFPLRSMVKLKTAA